MSELFDKGLKVRKEVLGEDYVNKSIAGADEFNDKIQGYFANKGLGHTTFRLDDDQLARIRSRRDDLFARWRAVSPGDTLELPFERDEMIAA